MAVPGSQGSVTIEPGQERIRHGSRLPPPPQVLMVLVSTVACHPSHSWSRLLQAARDP